MGFMGLHLKSSKHYPCGDLSPFFGKSFSCFAATGETTVSEKNADTDIKQAADDDVSTEDSKPKKKLKKKKEKNEMNKKKEATGETTASETNADGSTEDTKQKKKKENKEKNQKKEATGETTVSETNAAADNDIKQAANDVSTEYPQPQEKELICGIDPEDVVRVRGVCTLRSLRKHRWGVDAGRFYKTTLLTVGDGLELPNSGTSKRKTAKCKCPYSPCLCRRAALRPWKWIPFALRMLWARALCAVCQRWLHPAAPPPATRFTEHLAAADAARTTLMERNAKYARQSADPDPVFCLAAQVPYFDCDRGPNFAYREMMRRLRETRDRQLGRYEEEPITRECRIINGREMCDVGTQVAAQADGSLWQGAGRVMYGRATHNTLCHMDGAKLQLEREAPPSSDTLLQACVIKPIKKAVSKTKTQISDAIEKVLKDPVIDNKDELWHLRVKPIKGRHARARSRRTYYRPRREPGPLGAGDELMLDGRDTMDGDSPVVAPDVTSSPENLQKPPEMGDTLSKNNKLIDTKQASTASDKSDCEQQLQGIKSSTATADSQPTIVDSKNDSPTGSESSKSVSFTPKNEQNLEVVNDEKPKVITNVSVMDSNNVNDPKIFDNHVLKENKETIQAGQIEDISKNKIIEPDGKDTLGDVQISPSSTESNLIMHALDTKCRRDARDALNKSACESSSSCKGNGSPPMPQTDDQEDIAPDAADNTTPTPLQVQHVSVRAAAPPAARAQRPLLCARVARHAMMAPRQRNLAATGASRSRC